MLTHAEYANNQEIVKLLRTALEQEGGEDLIENEGRFEPVCARIMEESR